MTSVRFKFIRFDTGFRYSRGLETEQYYRPIGASLFDPPGLNVQHLNFSPQESDWHTGIGPKLFSVTPNEPFAWHRFPTQPQPSFCLAAAVVGTQYHFRHVFMIPTSSSHALPNLRPIHSLCCQSNPARSTIPRLLARCIV
jgi:hypothetical protein